MSDTLRYGSDVRLSLPILYGSVDSDKLIPKMQQYFWNRTQQKLPISYVYGSPNTCWNGGRPLSYLTNVGNHTPEYFSHVHNDLGANIFLTYTNFMAGDYLDDPMGNRSLNYLSEVTGGEDGVTLVDDRLLDHVRLNHPKLKTKASVIKVSKEKPTSRDSSYYNNLLDRYNTVMLHPDDNTNYDLINGIQDISRIEVLVDERCTKNCPVRDMHYDINAQYNVGNISEADEKSKHMFSKLCPREKMIDNVKGKGKLDILVNSIEEVDKLVSLGVRLFKTSGRGDAYKESFAIRRFLDVAVSDEDLRNAMGYFL